MTIINHLDAIWIGITYLWIVQSLREFLKMQIAIDPPKKRRVVGIF